MSRITRLFAAPFVLIAAAAGCGSPQPAEPVIMTNPPGPASVDAGVDEAEEHDAALPNMPDERDPISGEPDPDA